MRLKFYQIISLVFGLAAGSLGSASYAAPHVVGYFPYYASYRENISFSELKAAHYSHIIYQHSDVKPDGSLAPADEFVDLTKAQKVEWGPSYRGNYRALNWLKGKNPGLSILLSVGGRDFSKNLSTVAADSGKRERFVVSALETLEKYGFDGIEVDWRYPSVKGAVENGLRSPSDFSNFVQLLKEFRAACPHCSLVVTVPDKQKNRSNWEFAQLEGTVDFFTLLPYEFESDSTPGTGHRAPLFTDPARPGPSLDSTVKELEVFGLPLKDLVITVPSSGLGWKGVKNQNNGLLQSHDGNTYGTWNDPYSGVSGEHAYREMVDLIDSGVYEVFWAEDVGASFAYSSKDQIFISYESTKSIKGKLNYLDSMGLAGIAITDVTSDAPTPKGLSDHVFRHYYAFFPCWYGFEYWFFVLLPWISGLALGAVVILLYVFVDRRVRIKLRENKQTGLIGELHQLPYQLNIIIKQSIAPPPSIVPKLLPVTRDAFEDIAKQSVALRRQITSITDCSATTGSESGTTIDTSFLREATGEGSQAVLMSLEAFMALLEEQQSLEKMLEVMFDFLSNDSRVSSVALYSDKQLLKSNGNSMREAMESGVPPSQKQSAMNLNGERECAFVSGPDFADYSLNMHFSAPLTESEEVYFRSLCKQVVLVRKQIQGLANQPQLLSELYEITRRKESILFVKGEKGYSGIYADDTSTPALIYLGLRSIREYFPGLLIQVHRSYLINPKMVTGAIKQRYSYALILGGNEVVPISRGYLKKIKADFPCWFGAVFEPAS